MTAHTLYPIIQFGHANQPNNTSCLSSKAKAIIIHFCNKKITRAAKTDLPVCLFPCNCEQMFFFSNVMMLPLFTIIQLPLNLDYRRRQQCTVGISVHSRFQPTGNKRAKVSWIICSLSSDADFKSMYRVNNYWITETGRSDLFQCSLGILERISQGNRKMNL